MRTAVALMLLRAGLCVLAACDACGPDARVAELAKANGNVQRDFAGQLGRWQAAAAGADFEVGDGVRTGERSHAELALLPSGRLRVEAKTVVRFSATPPERGQGRIELEAGAIELEAVAADYEVEESEWKRAADPRQSHAGARRLARHAVRGRGRARAARPRRPNA